MREVILTIGPRASGKSSFCEKALALDPSIVEVSRDKILVELFGGTHFSPYNGEHLYAHDKMWELLRERLAPHESRVLLDTWNMYSSDRTSIIKNLRELGVTRIVAWHFITPVEVVEEWFWKKPGIAKYTDMKNRQGEKLLFFPEGSPRRDYNLFYQFASDIDSDGFDEVVRIDPVIIGPEHVIRMQTNLNL